MKPDEPLSDIRAWWYMRKMHEWNLDLQSTFAPRPKPASLLRRCLHRLLRLIRFPRSHAILSASVCQQIRLVIFV